MFPRNLLVENSRKIDKIPMKMNKKRFETNDPRWRLDFITVWGLGTKNRVSAGQNCGTWFVWPIYRPSGHKGLKIATSLKITTGVYTPQYKQTFTLTFLKVNFHLENQTRSIVYLLNWCWSNGHCNNMKTLHVSKCIMYVPGDIYRLYEWLRLGITKITIKKRI